MNYKLYMSYMGMKQLAEESEEWTASVDRGGLVCINNNAFQFLSAIGYRLRSHTHIDKTRDMDDTFREQVSTEIKEDDDVQFQWVMLSCGMEEEVSNNVLESIIDLYVTARIFIC